MPPLPNPRHERFAQELAKGNTADEAYVTAGYKKNRHNAAALAREQHIATRVQELQGRAAKKVEVTIESLMKELDEARDLALKINQPAAAVAATKEKGVLSGLRVEKRESTHKTDPSKMSDDELAAIASAGGSGAVAPSPRKSIVH